MKFLKIYPLFRIRKNKPDWMQIARININAQLNLKVDIVLIVHKSKCLVVNVYMHKIVLSWKLSKYKYS